jgi:hypothetical protein
MNSLLHIFKTRVGAALILSVLLIIGTIFYRIDRKPAVERGASVLSATIEKIVREGSSADTDGDGLSDWEESFYKTDPNNRDSDGDGVSDGDEVFVGQNPTQPLGTTPSSTNETNVGTTDRLSRDVFRIYLDAKKQYGVIDERVSEEIASTILSRDYSGDEQTYEKKDLRTVATSRTTLSEYGNALGSALSLPPTGGESEIDILERLAEESLDKYRADLNKQISRYDQMISILLSVKVPTTLIDDHLSIINGVALLKAGVEGALMLETDPIEAFVRLSRYEEGLSLIQEGVIDIDNVFDKNSITFSSYEPGAILSI